MKLLVCIKGTE